MPSTPRVASPSGRCPPWALTEEFFDLDGLLTSSPWARTVRGSASAPSLAGTAGLSRSARGSPLVGARILAPATRDRVHAFSHSIWSLMRITTFDVDGRQSNVIADANENSSGRGAAAWMVVFRSCIMGSTRNIVVVIAVVLSACAADQRESLTPRWPRNGRAEHRTCRLGADHRTRARSSHPLRLLLSEFGRRRGADDRALLKRSRVH
jgi:hypothetical protein